MGSPTKKDTGLNPAREPIFIVSSMHKLVDVIYCLKKKKIIKINLKKKVKKQKTKNRASIKYLDQ